MGKITVAILLSLAAVTFAALWWNNSCELTLRKEIGFIESLADRVYQFQEKHQRLPQPDSKEDLSEIGLSLGGWPTYSLDGPSSFELFSADGVISPEHPPEGALAIMRFDGPWVKYQSSNRSIICGIR